MAHKALARPPDDESFVTAREQIRRQTLAAASHDLKTPLTTIIGALEVYTGMNDQLTNAKRKALVRSALTEAYRLNNFIANVLDMARLETGMVQPASERFDLTPLIEDCVARLGLQRHRAQITLRPVGATKVRSDPKLLCRAVGILLENAIKHGGKYPHVIVNYGVRRAHGIIRVRDHGPGIPHGMKDAIFSKYTRLVKSDKQNAGTGLGLAICRQIMQVLSGQATVSNMPQKRGAVFSLIFPAR